MAVAMVDPTRRLDALFNGDICVPVDASITHVDQGGSENTCDDHVLV